MPCANAVCEIDSFCCPVNERWDARCAQEAGQVCGICACCGDGIVGVGEYCDPPDGGVFCDNYCVIIGCREENAGCCLGVPPQLAQHNSDSSGSLVDLVDLKMNRYLSIRAPGSVGRTQAIRVEFLSLPAPWNVWNGTRMFVTAPTTQCEAAGVGLNQPCPAGVPTLSMAGLSCDPGDAHFRDWANIPGGVIYVRHPGIVPQREGVPVYEIRMIDATCDVYCEDCYSDPKIVEQVRWGDVVGVFDSRGNDYSTPDGSVGITTDVTAALSKFSNRKGAPIKARVDVEPCLTDGKINISDIQRLLDAFRGIYFPFAPGQVAFGCASLDPCAYASGQ